MPTCRVTATATHRHSRHLVVGVGASDLGSQHVAEGFQAFALAHHHPSVVEQALWVGLQHVQGTQPARVRRQLIEFPEGDHLGRLGVVSRPAHCKWQVLRHRGAQGGQELEEAGPDRGKAVGTLILQALT